MRTSDARAASLRNLNYLHKPAPLSETLAAARENDVKRQEFLDRLAGSLSSQRDAARGAQERSAWLREWDDLNTASAALERQILAFCSDRAAWVLPPEEEELQALQVFVNPRQAKRHCGRSQRVIKIPDTRIFERTASHLLAQGISRLVIENSLYSLPGA